jgi:hypothetical protein
MVTSEKRVAALREVPSAAEPLLLKHQLLILKRSRKRAQSVE